MRLWVLACVSSWRARLSAVRGDSGGEAPGLGLGVMDSRVRRASLTTLGDIQVEMSRWTSREQKMGCRNHTVPFPQLQQAPRPYPR